MCTQCTLCTWNTYFFKNAPDYTICSYVHFVHPVNYVHLYASLVHKILFMFWVLCTLVYLWCLVYLLMCVCFEDCAPLHLLQDRNYGEFYTFDCTPVTLQLCFVSVPHLTWKWLSRPCGQKQRSAHKVYKVHQVHPLNRWCMANHAIKSWRIMAPKWRLGVESLANHCTHLAYGVLNLSYGK